VNAAIAAAICCTPGTATPAPPLAIASSGVEQAAAGDDHAAGHDDAAADHAAQGQPAADDAGGDDVEGHGFGSSDVIRRKLV